MTRLVISAQNGSEQAFSELYQAYFPQIYYYSLKRLRSDDLASEATQACFLGVCTNLNQLKSPEAFRYWIYCIARRAVNLVRQDFERRSQHELSLLDGDNGAEPHNSAFELEDRSDQGPEVVHESNEVHEALLSGVNQLPDQQREAVLLFYFAEFSIAEIAQIIDIKPGAVRKRLFDARAALKQYFIAPLEEVADETSSDHATRKASRGVLDTVFARDIGELDLDQAGSRVALGLSAALPLVVAQPGEQLAIVSRAQGFLNYLHAASPQIPSNVAHATHMAKYVVQVSRGAVSTGTKAAMSGTKTGGLILQLVAHKAVLGAAAALVVSAGAGGYAVWRQSSASATVKHDAPAPAMTPVRSTEEVPSVAAPAVSTVATQTAAPVAAQEPAKPNVETPRPVAKPTPTPAPAPVYPTITVAHRSLSYPAGSSVSAAQILADAGGTAHDASGATLRVTLVGYDTIDFEHPGTAHVYLQARDSAGLTESETLFVTITAITP